MSRQLPARPSLDHLKKQAKDLLGDLEQRNPGAKLADALHAVAREYGFATWPKLKEHVESLLLQYAAAEKPVHDNPFAGHWTADLSRSKRHPANQFRSATIELAVVGETVTMTDVVVDSMGREARSTHTIHVDGREHAAENGSGYVLMASWRDSHTLETVATKDGQVVGRGTYEISADGTTLTISAPEQVIVLERRRSAGVS